MTFYLKIRLKLLTAWTFLIMVAVPAYPQKKTVDVDLNIKEESYRLFYGDSISDLEVKGAEQLAQRLQANMPFVLFAGETGVVKATFTLDRQETGLTNPFIHRIDLHLGLILENGQATDNITYEFRSEERFDEPLPNTNAAFLQGLDAVLAFWLDQEEETIIRELFSQISLGEKAHPDKVNQVWALPFSQEGLGLAESSEFRVRSKIDNELIHLTLDYDVEAKGAVPAGSSLYPTEYRGNILGRLMEQRDIDRMGEVKIEGIYLIKLMRLSNEPQTEGPDPTDI